MGKPEFYKSLRTFAQPDNKKSIIQLANTIIPYLFIFALMCWLLKNEYSYWLVFLLAIINAGFLIRSFIIFHDCTHRSFLKSRTLCKIIGHFCGLFTFTPFHEWQYAHKKHHATSSNLDKRGLGAIWLMTVNEYYSSSKSIKFWYRLYRNPVFLFIVAPVFEFILIQRIPRKFKWNKEMFSHIITTGMMVIIIILARMTIGIKIFLLVQLPIICIGGSAGIFLFYTQHQFPNSYWSRDNEWDPFKASMDGASFYKLPGLLRWFTGSIGYHHVHHLHPAIPNYNLKRCYDEVTDIQKTTPLTFTAAFRNIFLKLYDEETKELVTYRKAKELVKKRT